MTVQHKLEAEVDAFQKLQKEYSTLVSTRTKLDSQLQENEMVKKEFDLLKEDAEVFKLVGPVLVKQEVPEAKMNVDKRIDYIRGEIKRTDELLKDLEAKQDKKKDEVMKLQVMMQQEQTKS